MKLSAFLQQAGEYPVQAGKPGGRGTGAVWPGLAGSPID